MIVNNDLQTARLAPQSDKGLYVHDKPVFPASSRRLLDDGRFGFLYRYGSGCARINSGIIGFPSHLHARGNLPRPAQPLCLEAGIFRLKDMPFQGASGPQHHSLWRPDRLDFRVSMLPLAAVFSLEFSSPIWTAILAAIFLKERLTRPRIMSILLGFAGILVILRPGSELLQPASFAVIGAAICFASTYVFTRGLTSTESAFKVIFYMNLIQLPMGLIPSIPLWATPSVDILPFVALLGVGGLSSHYCIARATAYADATIVSPLDFLRLPLIAIIGSVSIRSLGTLLFLSGEA